MATLALGASCLQLSKQKKATHMLLSSRCLFGENLIAFLFCCRKTTYPVCLHQTTIFNAVGSYSGLRALGDEAHSPE
jgi:hypothetical protein